MWRSSVDAGTGRVSVCLCGLSARTAVKSSIGMWSFLGGQSGGVEYAPGRSGRIAEPQYSTGTLPLLWVGGIQIEKITRLLSAQVFKHPEGFKQRDKRCRWQPDLVCFGKRVNQRLSMRA